MFNISSRRTFSFPRVFFLLHFDFDSPYLQVLKDKKLKGQLYDRENLYGKSAKAAAKTEKVDNYSPFLHFSSSKKLIGQISFMSYMLIGYIFAPSNALFVVRDTNFLLFHVYWILYAIPSTVLWQKIHCISIFIFEYFIICDLLISGFCQVREAISRLRV